MSLTAFLLILSSVLLHALWHFISKRQNPEFIFFIVFSLAIFLTMFPFFLFSGVIPWRLPFSLWLCILGGGLCGMLGDIGFSYAYRYADISQAYPMARALPVLLTALITNIFGFGKPLTLTVSAGMAIIFTGCILMPLPSLRHFSLSAYRGRGMFGILLAAAATTGYTVIDSFGIHGMINFASEASRICSAGAYSCIREFVVFSSLSLVSFLKTEERKHLSGKLFLQSQPYLAGFFAGLAYLLVLVAMGYVTNVSYIQAFRQLSLPIGLLLGILILKERATFQKIAGLALILTGLFLVALN